MCVLVIPLLFWDAYGMVSNRYHYQIRSSYLRMRCVDRGWELCPHFVLSSFQGGVKWSSNQGSVCRLLKNWFMKIDVVLNILDYV